MPLEDSGIPQRRSQLAARHMPALGVHCKSDMFTIDVSVSCDLPSLELEITDAGLYAYWRLVSAGSATCAPVLFEWAVERSAAVEPGGDLAP